MIYYSVGEIWMEFYFVVKINKVIGKMFGEKAAVNLMRPYVLTL